MSDPHFASGFIDIQTHYIAPEAARTLTAYRERGGIVQGLAGTLAAGDPMLGLETRLRAMDEAGVAISVLSFAPVGVIADIAVARSLCRAANDGLLRACAAYQGRFVMAAALPLPDPAAADEELARIALEDAVRAVQIVAQTTGYTPDDDAFASLFQRAADAGMPILIHPSAGVADLAPQFDVYGLSSGLHAMVSHALVAARMIQSGLLDRVERLELILTHLGGVLPFLIDRLDSRARGPALHPPSHYLRNRIFVDACGYPAGPALRCAIETFGAQRVMIGSDWPSRPIAPALEAIAGLDLAEADRRAILGGTAARWFDPARARVVQ